MARQSSVCVLLRLDEYLPLNQTDLSSDSRQLRDNQTASWGADVIAKSLEPYVLDLKIDTVRHPKFEAY